MKIRQVSPHEYFPSGDSRCLAVLHYSPREMMVSYGLNFKEGFDDFDCFHLAAVELEGAEEYGQFWLFRYLNSPERGTEVLVDTLVDPQKALQAFIKSLELTPEDLQWINEEPKE